MKNSVLSAILLVGALVYSEAAPDHLKEAYHVPSSYRDGYKWELGSSSHAPLNAIYKTAAAVPYVKTPAVQTGLYYPTQTQYGYRHATYNQVPVVHQPTYKYQQPIHQTVFKHVQPVHQPIVANVQQPVHQTLFRHVQQPIVPHVQPIVAATIQHPVYRHAGVIDPYTTGVQHTACVHV